METGAITQYVDVAQIVLYVFWVFFAGVIYYLVRENHREGYPMDSGRPNGPKITGWPIAQPKTYKLHNGQEVTVPNPSRPDSTYSAKPSHRWAGAPLDPVGDPLLAGIGPGSWSQRHDEPELTYDGKNKLVPLRADLSHGVSPHDVDPRGLPVYGADDTVGGKIKDLWVDRAEMLFRFLEVELPDGRSVLLPTPFCRILKDRVYVDALLGAQFANVPQIKQPEQVTTLEEDKIAGYYGAGKLYATPDRLEPLS
jgi:photosynthetic reaction center H subunit